MLIITAGHEFNLVHQIFRRTKKSPSRFAGRQHFFSQRKFQRVICQSWVPHGLLSHFPAGGQLSELTPLPQKRHLQKCPEANAAPEITRSINRITSKIFMNHTSFSLENISAHFLPVMRAVRIFVAAFIRGAFVRADTFTAKTATPEMTVSKRRRWQRNHKKHTKNYSHH